MRPVVNLKPLNLFLHKSHLKMEGLHVVGDLLQKGDWMCQVDLKDAYFAIKIWSKHRPLLHFIGGMEMFQFTCLPFGLASVPRVFTKDSQTGIVGLLHMKGS